MSRRTRAVKRPVLPDPVYGSETVTKFVNNFMFDAGCSTGEFTQLVAGMVGDGRVVGVDGSTLVLEDKDSTSEVLTKILNYGFEKSSGNLHRYR
jgi:trans-aconitate methyltransferase